MTFQEAYAAFDAARAAEQDAIGTGDHGVAMEAWRTALENLLAAPVATVQDVATLYEQLWGLTAPADDTSDAVQHTGAWALLDRVRVALHEIAKG
ncbi:MAG: hypothetical protein ACRC67_03905 [Inquilinus sp.]|uniref:hypothetical protein n=1 Tax=Inquilinus sp. TaxID=1932117 RepID=UPI003F2A509F